MPTLAEQVAALEAKLDHMRKKYEDCRRIVALGLRPTQTAEG